MNNIQTLIDKLYKLNPNWEININYTYKKDMDGLMTPYLIIKFGKYNINNEFQSGYINKVTGKMFISSNFLEPELYYECFEGGFEDNLENCLNRMINNIQIYLGNNKNE